MSDKRLGMHCAITRRDLLQGVAVAATTGILPAEDPYYPPTRLGLRGSHPGSFESAHALRDGQSLGAVEDTRESYDLIVVGAGISGLAAAHFFRLRAPNARILILDNHDDFGGHAKRNEFHVNGRMHLLNGGTMLIESPRPYGPVAAGLMKTLGVDPVELDRRCSDHKFYESLVLRSGTFFDKETFGVDRLVVKRDLKSFLAQAPLSAAARRDIFRIEEGAEDPLQGLTSEQKKDRLSRMSYRDYLLKVLKADASVGTYYSHTTDGWWGCGIDAVSALDCWGTEYPGFQGLKLAPGSTPRMGYTPAGYADTGGSPTFHFPDGNASIARLLVRNLIPEAMPGRSAIDVVTAKADYSKLDRPGAPVRIRLNSTVLRVRNGAARCGQCVACGPRRRKQRRRRGRWACVERR